MPVYPDNIIVWGWAPYGDHLYAITHAGPTETQGGSHEAGAA